MTPDGCTAPAECAFHGPECDAPARLGLVGPCGQEHYARGLCRWHYRRAHRRGFDDGDRRTYRHSDKPDDQHALVRRLLDEDAPQAEAARSVGWDRRTVRRNYPRRGWSPRQAGAHGNLLRSYASTLDLR